PGASPRRVLVLEVRGVSPDLLMQIFVQNLAWDRARRIARATRVDDAVPVHAERDFPFFGRRGELWTFAVHDLLADSADWNAETWDMEPAELPRLVRTLEILFVQIPEEFAVQVTWSGDRAEQELAV